MKKLFVLALVLFAQSGLAAGARTQTHMQLQPYFPVDCQERDYPLLNRVGPIERVAETKATATFQFRTFVGGCEQGLFLDRAVINQAASVGTYKNKIVLFQKQVPVISQVELVSSHEALVTLTFDKQTAFKKRSVSTYTMEFYPQGRPLPVLMTNAWGQSSFYQPYYIRFPWKVILTKVSASETAIELGVGRP